MVRSLQNGGIGPNLRFGGGPPGRKDSHDRPLIAPDAQFITQINSGKFLVGTRADDDFILASLERPPLDDFYIVANMKSGLFDASHWNIGVGATGAFWQVDDHEQLG